MAATSFFVQYIYEDFFEGFFPNLYLNGVKNLIIFDLELLGLLLRLYFTLFNMQELNFGLSNSTQFIKIQSF